MQFKTVCDDNMMTEAWNRNTEGVLYEEPLLLRANKAGVFGTSISYHGGSIRRALFTYLCGVADEQFFMENKGSFFGSWLVCMSREWEDFLRKRPHKAFRRVMMTPRTGESDKVLDKLPSGYTVTRFTREVFVQHPFGHAVNYKDYADFCKRGAGAAVLYNGEAAAAASSFLSFDDEIELDVFTAEAHRRKGLADHCVFEMLHECAERGLTVHWDAQNQASADMAMSHGFTVLQEYAAYELLE